VAHKAKAAKKTRLVLSPNDYRFPGESGPYWTGVAGIFILFIWIVIMAVAFKRKASGLPEWQWAYLFIWPVASIFLANYFSAKPRLAQIKKAGRQARVMPATHPDLYSALSQYAAMLGMKKPPDLYVINDNAAYIFAMPGRPGAILASQKLLRELTVEEFNALVAREVGSLAAHNVRVALAITWMRTSNPLVMAGLFPLYLMSVFMRGWVDITELSADRAAILLTGSESLVNLALVKLIIAQDPNADLNQEDLAAYMKGASDLTTDSAQLERHFRIGNFIEAQAGLRERIEQIREYRGSNQGQQAFAKLVDMKLAQR
jgi:Zn-dependent protease with chaperone function